MRNTAGEGVLDSVKRVPDAGGHAFNVQDIRVSTLALLCFRALFLGTTKPFESIPECDGCAHLMCAVWS